MCSGISRTRSERKEACCEPCIVLGPKSWPMLPLMVLVPYNAVRFGHSGLY